MYNLYILFLREQNNINFKVYLEKRWVIEIILKLDILWEKNYEIVIFRWKLIQYNSHIGQIWKIVRNIKYSFDR